jgi:hypothetical protein
MYLISVVFALSPTSHHDNVWLLPVISLFLTDTVTPVRACSIHMIGRGFVGPKKKTSVGLLVFNPLWASTHNATMQGAYERDVLLLVNEPTHK